MCDHLASFTQLSSRYVHSLFVLYTRDRFFYLIIDAVFRTPQVPCAPPLAPIPHVTPPHSLIRTTYVSRTFGPLISFGVHA